MSQIALSNHTIKRYIHVIHQLLKGFVFIFCLEMICIKCHHQVHMHWIIGMPYIELVTPKNKLGSLVFVEICFFNFHAIVDEA